MMVIRLLKMKHMKKLSSLLSAGLLTVGLTFGLSANALEVGDMAPNFSLKGSDGNTHTLSEMRGQYVVLAFFPKAYTKG